MTDSYLALSAEDFAALDDWQIRSALQEIAGHMAVAQAAMRQHSDAHHDYLAAKDRFAYLKSTATTLQTLLRSAK